MRFIKSFATAFLFLMGVLSASAGLSVTIKWNIPGSVALYVGGSGESYRIALAEDATEYVATLDNSWGSAYLAKIPGYEFDSVTIEETTLQPMYNAMYKIDMAQYDGKTANVVMEEVVYDRTMSVNVINGREALSATMWGTGREILFSTGEQTVAYSSKYEKGIDIQAPVEGSENPYIKQNGVEKEWKAYYSWDNNLYHIYGDSGEKGFGFDEGTDFEIKYCETEDSPETPPAVITLDFQNEMAREALTFIFNISEMKTITERDNFSAKIGEQVRLVFNTRDYTVDIDGSSLAPTGDTTPYIIEIEGDRTLHISASIREYENTTVTLATNDPEGILLRRGAIDGELIEISELTVVGEKSYSYTTPNDKHKTAQLTVYSATVSEKSPKIFVSEAPGYWLEACEYRDGSDAIQAGIATAEYELNVVASKIEPDTRVVVFVSTDNVNAKAEDLNLRDRNRTAYDLQAGYNEFLVDTEYSSPFSVTSYGMAEGSPMSVFVDMASVSKDDDSNSYVCNIDDESRIHIFAGRPAPSRCTISADIDPEISDCEITVDKLCSLDTENTECETFKGCEVSVNPAGNEYFLDGSKAEYEGETHIFKATGNHMIKITKGSGIESLPAEDIDTGVRFYNLQGVRITNPSKGELVIIRKGATSEKRIRQ